MDRKRPSTILLEKYQNEKKLPPSSSTQTLRTSDPELGRNMTGNQTSATRDFPTLPRYSTLDTNQFPSRSQRLDESTETSPLFHSAALNSKRYAEVRTLGNRDRYSSYGATTSSSSSRLPRPYLVEINSDSDNGDVSGSGCGDGGYLGRNKGKGRAIDAVDKQVYSVQSIVANVMDKIMNRGENVRTMKNSADRLETVSHMFRRRGEVMETEAWLQRMKAASLGELLFFGAVVFGSGLLFLLSLMFIERLLFPPMNGYPPPPTGTTPAPTTAPAPPPPAPPVSPPPGWPPGYPYPPPMCTTPPGSIIIPQSVLTVMEIFVSACVMFYVAKRVSSRPKMPRVRERYVGLENDY